MKMFNKKIVLITLLFSYFGFISADSKIDIPVVNLSGATLSLLGSAAVGYCMYESVISLVRKDYFVKDKYPYAQAWYDAMDQKYPIAHLNQKLFLQSNLVFSKKTASWLSMFNQILFPQSALIRINDLYGKQINNQMLSKKEQLFLAEQEFLLLHEAGHIEHNDNVRNIVAAGLLESILIAFTVKSRCLQHDASLNFPTLNTKIKINADSENIISLPTITVDFKLKDSDSILIEQKEKNNSSNVNLAFLKKSENELDFQIQNITYFLISAGISSLFIKFLLGRYEERKADEFAYMHGDDQCLEGGISFFESDLVNPLHGIENKELSPYIHVDSVVGALFQGAASCATVPVFYIGKTVGTIINSTSVTRWLYDASRDLVHPGPPARVHAIREEQKRRSEKNRN